MLRTSWQRVAGAALFRRFYRSHARLQIVTMPVGGQRVPDMHIQAVKSVKNLLVRDSLALGHKKTTVESVKTTMPFGDDRVPYSAFLGRL